MCRHSPATSYAFSAGAKEVASLSRKGGRRQCRWSQRRGRGRNLRHKRLARNRHGGRHGCGPGSAGSGAGMGTGSGSTGTGVGAGTRSGAGTSGTTGTTGDGSTTGSAPSTGSGTPSASPRSVTRSSPQSVTASAPAASGRRRPVVVSWVDSLLEDEVGDRSGRRSRHDLLAWAFLSYDASTPCLLVSAGSMGG